jgi:hypothetical protein
LIDKTLTSSDCQVVHVVVTSCVLPLEEMPSAVTCAVAPDVVNDERSANAKTTVWTMNAGGGVEAVGDEDPHAAQRLTTKTPRRPRAEGFIWHFQTGRWVTKGDRCVVDRSRDLREQIIQKLFDHRGGVGLQLVQLRRLLRDRR